MNAKTFPDFGGELRRPFEIHEQCYDCAAFYNGCKAMPETRRSPCGKYDPLPDVLPGMCGQEFPDSRPPATPETTTRTDRERRCECGGLLPKGRRLCDDCRDRNRQTTKRDYMRGYMQNRRGGTAADTGDGQTYLFDVA